MHVELHPLFIDTAEGKTARDLTSACVHCGFCLATCPTYLDSRDERDSPRGRIYLIKQLLETGEASVQTHTHLDRCLTCLNCETTCPSGMRYGRLVDIGRGLMERQVPRSAYSKGLRWLLRAVLSRPRLFAAALAVGQAVRPILPKILRDKVPLRQTRKPLLTGTGQHPRQMLILEGCAQSAATPNTNDAARRVLDRLGITLITAPGAGCCGAVNYHLGAHDDGLDNMRRNIDAWWPYIESDAEAIVNSASGCGSMLVEYAELLAHDPAYAHKAKRISQLTRDIGEVLLEEDLGELAINNAIGKIAVHTPCTLQHALGLPDLVPDLLGRAGFELAQTTDKHLCCGSAGTYSILQASTSQRLRDNKLRALTGDAPTLIATANVGCQLHMQGAAGIPVVHWIELLDTKN
jgi:glycolate oxidase iron-sulfur subunit